MSKPPAESTAAIEPTVTKSTVAVAETAAGRSAVAVVRVAGPRALRAVGECFLPAGRQPLAESPAGVIRFGRWLTPEGEEVVVCRRKSGHSGGDSQVVEIHCHGGTAAVAAVMRSLVERGCHEEPWTRSIERSAPSRVTAEAQVALRQAITERTAAILLDQAEGALELRCGACCSNLKREPAQRATGAELPLCLLNPPLLASPPLGERD